VAARLNVFGPGLPASANPATAKPSRPSTQAPLTSSDDAFLDELIDSATNAIQSYCNRLKAPFARQSYQETLGAYGDISMMLKATPIVTLTSVLQDGSALTDVLVEDKEAGLLYRRNQFFWSAQVSPGFAGRQTWPAFGAPMPLTEEPRFTANYIAGFLMPGQDLVGKATISASAVDNSFNDTAAGFPSLLQAGDIIVTSGFSNAANNGTFQVTGTPTASKVVVSATLVTEAAPAAASVLVSNLPQDLERAAVECVKAWWASRSDDPSIIEKQVGPLRVRYTEDGGRAFLPATCAGLLRAWARAA